MLKKGVSVIKEHGYEGEMIDGVLCLSVSAYHKRYFFLDGNEVFLGDIDNGHIVDRTPLNQFRKENPYLHYDDGTTHIIDSKGNFILIDTCDFEKTMGICWCVVHKGADRFAVMGWQERKEVFLTKHLFGRVVKYNTDDRLNFTKANIIHTKKEQEQIQRLDEFVSSPKQSTKSVSYSNVIQPTGVEGTVVNDYLILSRYRGNRYYVRFKFKGRYVIGIMLLSDIKSNTNSVVVPCYLKSNPYLDFEDGTSVVFDRYANPILLDTADRKANKYVLHYTQRGSGDTKFVQYYTSGTNGDATTYPREILGVTDFNKIVIYRNGDSSDIRRSNIAVAPRGSARFRGKVPVNSTTGVLGVVKLPTDKYKATFQGKVLGLNLTFDGARELRKKAEREYYERIFS